MEEKMSAIGGKVAIISDIHNNEVNLKKVLDYCKQENIQAIICCGDLASQETLHFALKNFAGTFYYAFGNMDDDYLREFEHVNEYQNAKLFTKFGELEFEVSPQKNIGRGETSTRKIAFIHYPNAAKELCETEKYDFVFYGHTHKPWEETIGKCKMLNPGNVAGEIYPPTFAVWNTENNKFELIRIHDLK